MENVILNRGNGSLCIVCSATLQEENRGPMYDVITEPVTHLCPGVMWFSASGAHEEVNTLVSESCSDKHTRHRCFQRTPKLRD